MNVLSAVAAWFEESPAAVATTDLVTGRFVTANRAFRELVGYTLDELRTLEPPDLVHPVDRRERGALDARRLGARSNIDVELRIQRKDGAVFHGRGRAWLAADDAGQPATSMLLLEDVSARREAEDALRASEEELQTIFDVSGTGIAIIRSDGRIERVNDAFADILGVSTSALTSVKIDGVFEGHPSSLMADLAAAGGAPIQRNWHLKSRNGLVEYVGLTATPIRDRLTERYGALVTLVDLTKMKRAKEQLVAALAESEHLREELLAAVPDSIIVVSRAGRIVDANPAACATFGYPREALLALPIEALVPAARRAAHTSHRDTFFRAPHPRSMGTGMELHAQRSDGTEFPVDITLGQVRGAESDLVIAVVRDMTEQVAAAAAIREQRERLRRAGVMETLGRLSAGLAHDFNNILQVVTASAADAAERVEHDKDVLPCLAEILTAAGHAGELTRELLNVGRRGSIAPKKEPADVNAVVERSAWMIRRILGREVVLELSLGEVGETRALARELEQVLFNLVVNAREAITNSGTVRISTSLRSAEAGPSVVLEVSDDGSGMSADTLARISTPFFTTKARGSGVGLTTVFETVQRWGGTVEVDSTLGGGTTFRVLVPSTPAQQRTQSPTHQHRVLLVDDDDTALTVIGDALRSAGFEVVQCNGGDLALDVFARESVDVVVSDIVMPRMRGTELARRVHERSQGVPVVLMSAHPRERFGGEVDATVSFLQKPFSPSVLVSKVHEVIAAR